MSRAAFTHQFPELKRSMVTQAFISHPESTDWITVRALWDTGAGGSFVSRKFIEKLQLDEHAKWLITTPHGKDVPTTTYLADLAIDNDLEFRGIEVGVFDHDRDTDIVIGMDVLGQGDLSITNFNRRTQISFIRPSIYPVDYTEDAD